MIRKIEIHQANNAKFYRVDPDCHRPAIEFGGTG